MPATSAPPAKVVEIDLHEHYRGFVNGIVKAGTTQRAFVQILHKGTEIASTTFKGQGEGVNLKNVMDGREYWSFGPLDFSATMKVTIYHEVDGKAVPSTVLGPFKTHKAPERDLFPMEFYQATVISEDGADKDYNDCTVTVLQYK